MRYRLSVKRDRSLKLQRLLAQIISSMLESAPTNGTPLLGNPMRSGARRGPRNWMAHHIGLGHLAPAK